jgi:hypothetical protein
MKERARASPVQEAALQGFRHHVGIALVPLQREHMGDVGVVHPDPQLPLERKDVAVLFRTCSALLVLLSACATTGPSPKSQAAGSLRLANLQRAAALPWTDDGHCVVREAENEWPVLAERCFHALDHERVRFQDVKGRCAVAQAGAAAVGGAALCEPALKYLYSLEWG